jgi:hypothetical protein
MSDEAARTPPASTAGLCAACRHARPVASARGSTFVRCDLGATDPRFPKYPRLPVVRCDGFAPRPKASNA